MSNGIITIGVDEIEKLKHEAEKIETAPKTALQRVTSDAKKRVPGWVSREVTKVYNIKKSEVMPGGGGEAGRVSVRGNALDNLTIVYVGRRLTPTHFGMTPKSPGKGSYTLKHQVIKGQKKVLGKVKKLTKKQRRMLGANLRGEGVRHSPSSPIMLMPASSGGQSYIPFQRISPDRKDIEPIKTISMPQMVSSDRTASAINKAINDGLEKRLTYHLGRLMPGD